MQEPELGGFLKQFGKVLRIRISRSAKTGGSRGYGFVQMADASVAAIVADTMSGYLLMGERRLVCHIIPDPRPRLFAVSRHAKEEMARRRQPKPLEITKAVTERIVQRQAKKRQELQKLGIDYDCPGYVDTLRKRKDSVGSVDDSAKKKKRKDSVGSVGESERKDEKVEKKKKRSSSVASDVEPTTDEATRKRSNSTMSAESTGSARGEKIKKRSKSVDAESKKKKKKSKQRSA